MAWAPSRLLTNATLEPSGETAGSESSATFEVSRRGASGVLASVAGDGSRTSAPAVIHTTTTRATRAAASPTAHRRNGDGTAAERGGSGGAGSGMAGSGRTGAGETWGP